jgi:hypothetical protein
VNQTYHVNNGAVDPDGDSLVFSLSNAMSFSGPLTYVFPYSATDPMSSSTPITLDAVSGDFVVTPNAIQVAVVTFLVEEYPQWVFGVGSSIRDIQLIVKTGADQLPVLSGIDNTTSFQTSIIADSNAHLHHLQR